MKSFYELRFFLILWLTQAFSSLGSAMTNFALVLWLYQDSGSALKTAMLTVCSSNVINLKRLLNGKQNVWKYQNGEKKSDSDGREKDV